MALNDYETSRDRGQPVELYKFVYGEAEGRVYRYTNADQQMTVDGEVYKALPLQRDKIKTKGRGEGVEITVEVPLSSEISELFRIFPPGFVVALTIRQGHIPNSTDTEGYTDGGMFPVIWAGRVLESRRGDNTTTLNCKSSEAGMKHVGLRRHYQWGCPLVLYGPRCNANKSAATTTVAVEAVSGNSVSLPGGWHGSNAPTTTFSLLVDTALSAYIFVWTKWPSGR